MADDDGEDFFFFLLSLVLDDEAALVPSQLVDEAELPTLVFLGSNESGTGGCRTVSVYPGGTA